MRTIQAMGDSFASAVLSPATSDVQCREMRRAFYGGAHTMLCIVKGLGDDNVSEDAGVAVLESLLQESQAFANRVVQGRA